jgi:hypothetical protein
LISPRRAISDAKLTRGWVCIHASIIGCKLLDAGCRPTLDSNRPRPAEACKAAWRFGGGATGVSGVGCINAGLGRAPSPGTASAASAASRRAFDCDGLLTFGKSMMSQKVKVELITGAEINRYYVFKWKKACSNAADSDPARVGKSYF